MKIRSSRISSSISHAISRTDAPSHSIPSTVAASIIAFFAVFHVALTRFQAAEFLTLRDEIWELDEDEYRGSFEEYAQPGAEIRDESDLEQGSTRDTNKRGGKGKGKDIAPAELVPVGDLGYSGSTFFTTANGKYLVKSLPRAFEYEFFAKDLFAQYLAHSKLHPGSLLARITDMPYAPHTTFGGLLGLAPTHHIVMENLLYGKEEDENRGGDGQQESGGESAASAKQVKWETYDLKPESYFFPERDIADGKLAPQSVKDKLIDTFPDKIRVTTQMRDELLAILGSDTQLLADNLAVDYSLFLIRYPGPSAPSRKQRPASTSTGVPPSLAPSGPWRSGVDSVDGQWTYRAIVLDFFWAKHKLRAKMMTWLVDALNLVVKKGPMSVTAEPGEYRQRFLKMVGEMVVEG